MEAVDKTKTGDAMADTTQAACEIVAARLRAMAPNDYLCFRRDLGDGMVARKTEESLKQWQERDIGWVLSFERRNHLAWGEVCRLLGVDQDRAAVDPALSAARENAPGLDAARPRPFVFDSTRIASSSRQPEADMGETIAPARSVNDAKEGAALARAGRTVWLYRGAMIAAWAAILSCTLLLINNLAHRSHVDQPAETSIQKVYGACRPCGLDPARVDRLVAEAADSMLTREDPRGYSPPARELFVNICSHRKDIFSCLTCVDAVLEAAEQ